MQRKRIKPTTTFEERLAEKPAHLKKPPKKRLQAAPPESCFCDGRGRPRRRPA